MRLTFGRALVKRLAKGWARLAEWLRRRAFARSSAAAGRWPKHRCQQMSRGRSLFWPVMATVLSLAQRWTLTAEFLAAELALALAQLEQSNSLFGDCRSCALIA